MSKTVSLNNSHYPLLKSGKYVVTFSQTLDVPDVDSPFHSEKSFHVAGERFQLNPLNKHSVFPPANSIGDHSNVLPHIVLNRSTLPWERMVFSNDNDKTPWLALLLLYEDELDPADREEAERNPDRARTKVMMLEKLIERNTNIIFPEIDELGPGEDKKDLISVLDIPQALLNKIFSNPLTKKQLNLLAHVRKTPNPEDLAGEMDQAVIFSTRLPEKDAKSTAFLISLEERLGEDGKWDWESEGIEAKDVRFVCLSSWCFSCPEHYKVSHSSLIENPTDEPDLKELKTGLSNLEGESFWGLDAFKDKVNDWLYSSLEKYKKHFEYGTFTNILKHLNRSPSTLQLSPQATCSSDANDRLKHSFVPLPHQMLNGGSSACWYRGPLTADSQSERWEGAITHVKMADELLKFDQKYGMFDVSYAAAWELGRLLLLRNKTISISLAKFKREHRHYIMIAERLNNTNHEHLQIAHGLGESDIPKDLLKFFEDLALLEKVPFSYLLPAKGMLPVESIRFFYIDKKWQDCLQAGALSIGTLGLPGRQYVDQLWEEIQTELQTSSCTGFFLRSQVISGWPDLQVVGFDNNHQPLTMRRRENLSDDVLICIFEGQIQSVEIHLKPEALHFGFDIDDNGDFYKTEDIFPVKIDQNGIFDLTDIPERTNSSEFAEWLTEGVQGVRFSEGLAQVRGLEVQR
ncbi:MAG: hypothetical protein ACI8RA_001901 [Chlamydiales bacterium]|jgi:hypothetical protein